MTQPACSPEPMRTDHQPALPASSPISDALLYRSPGVLTPDEVAALTGCTVPTVLQWISSHALPAIKIGSSTALVLRRDLHIFITRHFLAP